MKYSKSMQLWLILLAGFAALFIFVAVGTAAAKQTRPKAKARVIHASKHDKSSMPARDLKMPKILKPRTFREVPLYTVPPATDTGTSPRAKDSAPTWSPPQPIAADASLSMPQSTPLLPAASIDFDGIGNLAGVAPPDTCGDVGPDHYVQVVNMYFQVFAKSGTSLLGPLPINSLWTGFGGACENTNSGDPIVLYDQFADRWLISQFALDYGGEGFHQCIAVSTSGDPTSTWYRYDYFMSDTIMNDYPKFGVWPDGYYMAINQFDASNNNTFAGQGVAVFERDKMLTGQAAVMQYIDLNGVVSLFGMLPSDADGLLAPAVGEPNHFVKIDDDDRGNGADQLVIYDFHVDWADPGNTTFEAPQLPVAVNPFVWFSGDVPQPDTGQLLDVIGDRLMYRLQYRNFDGYSSMVVNHTINEGGTAMIRWYELRNPGTGWVINQQGTYGGDSADGNHRWMGSIAMDSHENIALGYSVTSDALFPSISYTGRMAGDAAGTLPQGETELIGGGGSQTGTNRWGDYSMMSVDPVNDCTFWYTQEYYPVTDGWDWHTRIGSFTFPVCPADAKGELSGTVYDENSNPLAGVEVHVDDGAGIAVSTITGADGAYRFAALPPGTYEVTATKYSYLDGVVAGVMVSDAAVTTRDFILVFAPIHTLSGTVTDATTGMPLYAKVNYGPGTLWTDPLTGFYSIDLPQGDLTVEVTSFDTGYGPVIRSFLLDGNRTEDFALTVSASCDAPGYALAAPLAEQFTSCVLPAGWDLINNGGECTWTFDDPEMSTNLTGGAGCFADANSDFCGDGSVMDTELISPALDCTSMASVTLEFKYDIYTFTGTDTFEVDLSTDGGLTWTNVFQRLGVSERGPKTAMIDVTTEAAGQSDVQVRFHYVSPAWEWWWQVDDVFVYENAAEKDSCIPPVGGGYVYGNVLDDNTAVGLNNAMVEDVAGHRVFSRATPDDPDRPDGFYALYLPNTGTADLTTSIGSPSGYGSDTRTVNIAAPLSSTFQDFHLPAGRLGSIPDSITVSVPADGTEEVDFLLSNSGGLGASFQIAEREGVLPLQPVGPFADNVRHMSPKHLDALDASGARYTYPDPGVGALAGAGGILQTWQSNLTYPWGTAFDKGMNRIWLGNIKEGGGDDLDYEFETKGIASGRTLDVSKIPQVFMADFAYDAAHKTLWQMNVGGDDCIHELDPATLTATGSTICPAFGISQRGLAYNPKTDTFYAGSWNDSTVYEFDRSATILRSVNVGLPISGLAFNPATDHLFVMNSTDSLFPIVALDVLDNFSARFGIAIDGFSDLGGGGLAMDCDGDLWLADKYTGTVYEVTSGETGDCSEYEISWLSETPAAGSTDASSSSTIGLFFDATGIGPGETRNGYLIVETDTPYASIFVPVTMQVMNLPVVGAVTKQQARISTVVDPHCQTTEYYFEYGTVAGVYDQRTASIFRSSCSPVTIEALLTGLQKGTTYYIRLVAVNGDGTIYSGTVSFTTDVFPWFIFMPAYNAQSPSFQKALP